jgi:thiol:disulfide interchange protein
MSRAFQILLLLGILAVLAWAVLFSPAKSSPAAATEAPTLFTSATIEEAKAQATAEKKLLVVDLMADWCGPCKEMDRTTWVDPKVVSWFAENAIAAQVDVDENGALATELKVSAIPLMVVFRDGQEVGRTVGYQSSDQLLSWLSSLKQ